MKHEIKILIEDEALKRYGGMGKGRLPFIDGALYGYKLRRESIEKFVDEQALVRMEDETVGEFFKRIINQISYDD